VPEEEAVREPQRGARADGLEHPAEELGLRGVRDEEKDQIGLADHVEHLAQRAVGLAEARLAGLLHRARAAAQPHLHGDAGALERVTQVLRLGRPLRAPADDADLLDAREGARQKRQQVPPALDDLLLVPLELEGVHLEELRREIERHRHGGLLAGDRAAGRGQYGGVRLLRKVHCS
jgi:hypothetical protein